MRAFPGSFCGSPLSYQCIQEQSGPNKVRRTCSSKDAQIDLTRTGADMNQALRYKEVVTSAGSLLSAAVPASWLAVFGTHTKLTTFELALVCAHVHANIIVGPLRLQHHTSLPR
jgi:hypothetical protein